MVIEATPQATQLDSPTGYKDREMCENHIPRKAPINPVRCVWGVPVTPGDTLADMFQKALRRWLMNRIEDRPDATPPRASAA